MRRACRWPRGWDRAAGIALAFDDRTRLSGPTEVEAGAIVLALMPPKSVDPGPGEARQRAPAKLREAVADRWRRQMARILSQFQTAPYAGHGGRAALGLAVGGARMVWKG